MPERRAAVPVRIGGIVVGGDAPVVVQSMTNTDTADIEATAAQVIALARAGSELVRITVDRAEAAAAVPHIRDLRSELLLKMTFLRRAGKPLAALLEAQREVVAGKAGALEARAEDGDVADLWRATMAQAALGFIERALERERSGSPV